jgi:hypothetical protein
MAAISAYTSRLGNSYVIAEKHDLIFCYIHLLLWFMSILGYIPAYGGVSLTINRKYTDCLLFPRLSNHGCRQPSTFATVESLGKCGAIPSHCTPDVLRD